MKSLRITFLLFTLSVLISQSAMDFFSAVLCLQWAYMVWRARSQVSGPKLFQPMGLEKIWAIWWLIAIMGFLLNWQDSGYAFERILEFRWILILYVLFQVLTMILPDQKSLRFLIPMGLLISGVNLFLFFAEIDFLSPWRYGFGEMVRAGGFFANPMTFAHSFSVFTCFLLGLFIVDSGNWKKQDQILMALVLLFSLVGLYFTYTRGVWIGFAVGVFVGLLMWRLKALVAVVLVSLVGFTGLYHSSDLFRFRVDRTLSEIQGESERKVIWKAHGIIFLENPIFGAGYGQNTKQLAEVYERISAPKSTLISHAHNQYLHLAAGTGALGLICYLIVWGFFLGKSFLLWRHPKIVSWDRGVILGLIMGQVSFLIAGLTEANFEHSKVRFMVMLAWAYVIYLAGKYQVRIRRGKVI